MQEVVMVHRNRKYIVYGPDGYILVITSYKNIALGIIEKAEKTKSHASKEEKIYD